MGSTITKLVFRPPKPTPIRKDRFFYIEVPAETSLFSCSPTEAAGCSIVPPNLQSQNNRAKAVNCTHRIPAFFLLRRGARLTLLYSHGNAEDLGMMYRRMKDLARVLGVNVLAYDYSGYGLSQPPCEPSEKLCYRNIDAAYNYLTNVMKIPPSTIILYGRSLGSGPSCYLAKRTADLGESVAGLILHSPFLSIYRIVIDMKSGFVGDIFQSYTRARSIKCPVFIIHGENDQVVPFWHSDELLRSFQPQYRALPFFIKGLGHNNIEVRKRQEYIQRVLKFLESCVINGRIVPANERYLPGTTLNDSGRFLVNHTWIKHGREIVRQSIQSNSSKSNRGQQNGTKPGSKRASPMVQSHDIVNQPVAIVRSNTGDLLAKVIADGDKDNEGATQFLRTTESWDTEGTDVRNCSFDSKVALGVAGRPLSFPHAALVGDLEKMDLSQSEQTQTKCKGSSLRGRERNYDRDLPFDNITNQL